MPVVPLEKTEKNLGKSGHDSNEFVSFTALKKEGPVKVWFKRSAIIGAHRSVLDGKSNITVVYLSTGEILEAAEDPGIILFA